MNANKTNMQQKTIKIATRKSPLALIQAQTVKQMLTNAFPDIKIMLFPINTSGDANISKLLADIGGKGLFTKELEEGLLNGTYDIAVHSLKDMETHPPKGLIIGATLERDDPRDALIAHQAKTIANLPQGAKIGTASLRRAAQLKMLRPDFNIVPLRGNVATRLEKLKISDIDATLLAVAGLKRLGLLHEATEIFELSQFVPAVGQGVIAIECKEDNQPILEMLQKINHAPTMTAITAERKLLAMLDGSCRTPIGAYSWIEGNQLTINAIIAKADGKDFVKTTKTGIMSSPELLGEQAALELLANGGRECLV